MKIIYKGTNARDLTADREYLSFEICISVRNGTRMFRVVNDFGVPSLYDLSDFDPKALDLSLSVLFTYEHGVTITVKEIADLCESNSINDLWERYFNNEKEIVSKINECLEVQAKKEGVSIVKPSPYGTYE